MPHSDFSPRFAAAFQSVATDLRAACAAGLVWKEADHAWLGRVPAAIGQHRNAYCLAVKRDADRVRRCRLADNRPAEADGTPRCRTCPFGVVEVAVPVIVGDDAVGLAWLGSWRSGNTAPLPGLEAAWRTLPPFPGQPAALAMARLVQPRLVAAAAGRDRADARARQAGDATMAAAAAWIAGHATAGLRAPAAAAASGLSLSRFLHRFRTATGMTFAEHRDACVMERARHLLTDPTRRIIDIALDLGFASHSRFCESFRRHHQNTPSAWRRRLATRGA